MRREFTKAMKAAMIRRASDARGRIHCEGCGCDVTGKRTEFDHRIPEALRTAEDLARPLTIEDGQLLGAACCHSEKTAKRDVPAIAKAKRREAKHYGFRKPVGRPMPGTRRSGWKQKIGGTWERRT